MTVGSALSSLSRAISCESAVSPTPVGPKPARRGHLRRFRKQCDLRLVQCLLALGFASTSASVAADTAVLPSASQQVAAGFDNGVQSIRSELRLKLEHRLSPKAGIVARGSLTWDDRNRLEPGKVNDDNRSSASRRIALGKRAELELHELYADAAVAGWFIRAGRQQIVWGESDGIKVLDIVNPQNFREGVLEDAERARIALWSLHAETPLGRRGALEFVLIPDLSFHDIPRTDALFAITSPRLAPPRPSGATSVVPVRTLRPALGLGTLEFGARFRGAVGAWEGALIAFRHYNDVPVQRLRLDAMGPVVERSYAQTVTLGAQGSHPLGPLLIRGEAAWTAAAPLPALGTPTETRQLAAPLVAGLLAADYPLRGAGLISLQYAQLSLLADARNAPALHQQRYLTALLRDEFARLSTSVELFATYAMEDRDWLLRLRAEHRVNDQFSLQLGTDFFAGSASGVFGQHRHLDRLLAGFTVEF